MSTVLSPPFSRPPTLPPSLPPSLPPHAVVCLFVCLLLTGLRQSGHLNLLTHNRPLQPAAVDGSSRGVGVWSGGRSLGDARGSSTSSSSEEEATFQTLHTTPFQGSSTSSSSLSHSSDSSYHAISEWDLVLRKDAHQGVSEMDLRDFHLRDIHLEKVLEHGRLISNQAKELRDRQPYDMHASSSSYDMHAELRDRQPSSFPFPSSTPPRSSASSETEDAHTATKVNFKSLVTIHSKYSRALTFQNVCVSGATSAVRIPANPAG